MGDGYRAVSKETKVELLVWVLPHIPKIYVSSSLSLTLSVAQWLADSPNFLSSKNPRTFSQIININE